jgi:hypothetical protein
MSGAFAWFDLIQNRGDRIHGRRARAKHPGRAVLHRGPSHSGLRKIDEKAHSGLV